MTLFNQAFEETIIENEGGYVNHRADRGGETFMGISRKHHPNLTALWDLVDEVKKLGDIKKLHENNSAIHYVKAFYAANYWAPLQLDEVYRETISHVPLRLFDMAVNMGVKTAGRFFQRGLNYLNRNQKLFEDLVVDGVIGPKTLWACNKLNTEDMGILLSILILLQGKRYLDLMDRHPSQEAFCRGWIKRLQI